MAYDNNDVWDDLYKKFLYDLSEYGLSLEGALRNFVERYEYSKDQEEVEKQESRDVYFERKMKPIWDYVYNLQKQYTTLLNKVNDIDKTLIAYKGGGPGPAYPTYTPPQVPNYYGPAGDYPLDWYKVTCHADGNLNIGRNEASKFQTTGYMKVEDPKYTEQQIKEWSNIRFDDPAKRK